MRIKQKRKAVYSVAALCAVIFLGGIGGMIWNLTRSHGRQVEILQDGELLYTLNFGSGGGSDLYRDLRGQK